MIEIKRRNYNFMLQFFVIVLRTVPPSRARLIRRDVQTTTANESSPLAQVEARSVTDTDSFLQNLEARWPSLKHVRGLIFRRSIIPRLTPEKDQLISQSLICLRVYLEALDIKGSTPLGEELDILCEGSYCNVNCIVHLTSASTFCLDELSRRLECSSKRRKCAISPSGCPPTFYSLCIQSKVRRCLIKLIRTTQ